MFYSTDHSPIRRTMATPTAAAILLAAAATAACTDTDTNGTTPATTPVAAYDSTYSEAYNLFIVSDDTTAYETEAYNGPLTDADNTIAHQLGDYAADMLTEYDSQGYDNTVLSPVSASMLYGLMGNFVEQESDNAFLDAMGMEQASTEEVNTFFRKFINKKGNTESQASGSQAAKSRLTFASNLWMDTRTAVFNSFISKSRFYGFGVKGMDLTSPGAINAINGSIASNLGGKGATLPAYLLQAKASTVITSTMNFEGKWLYPMSRDTTLTTFTNADGTHASATIIGTTQTRGYARFNSFDVVELKYKEDTYAMYVILPHSTRGLTQCLNELNKRGTTHVMEAAATDTTRHRAVIYTQRDTTYYVFNDTMHPADERETATITVTDTLISDTVFDIRLPKFDVTTTTSLSPTGTNAATATKRMYQTNLPKVAPSGFHLTNVFQTCRISIDENGTTAMSRDSLAVLENTTNDTYTGATPGGESFPIYIGYDKIERNPVPRGRKTYETIHAPFTATRPFALFIRDKEVGTIPFASTIKNLRSAAE
ncbi:MAG: hypothetical protein IJS59_06860 [Bacteroidaceae bacterium]|nr:hypothetical protein [Bacteroidaceae bacterium]